MTAFERLKDYVEGRAMVLEALKKRVWELEDYNSKVEDVFKDHNAIIKDQDEINNNFLERIIKLERPWWKKLLRIN